MKEATGEANMTVVTIILIAIIVAVATPLINSMMKNTKAKADCMNEGKIWSGGKCTTGDATGTTGTTGTEAGTANP